MDNALAWLETNVRKPYLEGSVIDKYITSPLKKAWCAIRRQD